MRLNKYSEVQLREAVKTSQSIAETLKKLNVLPYGGNYDIFRKELNTFKLILRISLVKVGTKI